MTQQYTEISAQYFCKNVEIISYLVNIETKNFSFRAINKQVGYAVINLVDSIIAVGFLLFIRNIYVEYRSPRISGPHRLLSLALLLCLTSEGDFVGNNLIKTDI